MRFFVSLIFFFSFLFPQLAWYNHSELEWKTFETEHFIINFHNETERSAQEASIVAEKVYDKITALYDFKPKTKTTIIIKDVDDYSNLFDDPNWNFIKSRDDNFELLKNNV